MLAAYLMAPASNYCYCTGCNPSVLYTARPVVICGKWRDVSNHFTLLAAYLMAPASIAAAAPAPASASRCEIMACSCSRLYGWNTTRLEPKREAMRGMRRSGKSSVLAMPMTASLEPLREGHSHRLYSTCAQQPSSILSASNAPGGIFKILDICHAWHEALG